VFNHCLHFLQSEFKNYLASTLLRLSVAISVVGVIMVVFSPSLSLAAQSNAEQALESEFVEDTTQVEGEINEIQQQLDQLISNFSQNSDRRSTLSAEVSAKRLQIDETDRLITDTRLVIGQIEKQQEDTQAEIDALGEDISRMYIEIQEHYTPIKVILTGRDVGDILSRFYMSSSITKKIEDKLQEKEDLQAELEETRQQNLELQSQLEQSRALLKSEEGNLDALLTQTNGQESEYQKLLDAIATQKLELEAQLGSLQGEYLSELQDLRDAEQDQNLSSTNCSFEDKSNLDPPLGFFGSPYNGVLTQPFHCGHDGLDIAGSFGADLYSVADGTVEKVGPNMTGCVGLGCNGGFGNYIVIKHQLPNGRRVYSLYAHMRYKTPLTVGTQVSKGTTIGQMGCTGFTKPYPCGVHLHFVMLNESYETGGIGCRLGGSECFNPQRYLSQY
jgi:murein DD-endopeptidase MepM/ murein hydrolase activator NlpD